MNDFFGDINIKRSTLSDENSILEDFSANVEIRVNGEVINKNENIKNKKTTPLLIKNNEEVIYTSDTPMDPEAFFASSLKGFI